MTQGTTNRCTAIILAAGQGQRMHSDIPKQYLLLKEKPILYYALKAFQESFIDRIILVTSEYEIDYCRKSIVEKYGFNKVEDIVAGGRERYHSVYEGIQAAGECDYVFIHDAARPFITQGVLERAYACVVKYDACVIGMPAKDTIKIADEDGFAAVTPKRNLLWTVQTPQVFSYKLIKEAYTMLIKDEKNILEQGILMTDDAMVIETFTDKKVKLTEGSYENIKITTPEDLKIADSFEGYWN